MVLHEPAVTFTFAQVVFSMPAIAGSSGTFLFQFQQIEEVNEGEPQIFLQLWLGNASGVEELTADLGHSLRYLDLYKVMAFE